MAVMIGERYPEILGLLETQLKFYFQEYIYNIYNTLLI